MNTEFSGDASHGAFRPQLELLGEMLRRTGTATGTARCEGQAEPLAESGSLATHARKSYFALWVRM